MINFIRRYLSKRRAAKIECLFGHHKWTEWREPDLKFVGEAEDYASRAKRYRTCKVCKIIEYDQSGPSFTWY